MIDIASVVIREDLRPGDKNFILATFLRGLYYGDLYYAQIPKDIFMKSYHDIIDHLIHAPTTKVRIACLRDDPDHILGYSLGSKAENIIHWVFVKAIWRSIGVGKQLIPNDPQYVTHLTKVGVGLLKKKPHIQFNPFVINR